MYTKKCPNCGRRSYSSSRNEKSWNCPHCGEELDKVEVESKKSPE